MLQSTVAKSEGNKNEWVRKTHQLKGLIIRKSITQIWGIRCHIFLRSLSFCFGPMLHKFSFCSIGEPELPGPKLFASCRGRWHMKFTVTKSYYINILHFVPWKETENSKHDM